MNKHLSLIITLLATLNITATASATINNYTAENRNNNEARNFYDSELIALASTGSTESNSYSASYSNNSTTTTTTVRTEKKKFNHPQTDDYWGLAAGYVSKSWTRQNASGEKTNIGVYDDGWLHGIQFGIRYNPQFNYGFGMDTGLYYEYYHNKSSQCIEERPEGTFKYFKTLNEHVLRLPIHLEYRLNFTQEFQLFFFGGVAGEYVLSGNMSFTEQGYQAPYEVDKNIYGTIIPSAQRYNVAASFGGGFRFSALQFNIGSELGLLNVSPSADYILKQNKPLHVTLSIMF